VNDVAVLPKNVEIEAALREHQRLFGGDSHDHTLKEQRRIALDTMRMLNEFQPRLVGSVLTGTATAHSDINLHLFADASESVGMPVDIALVGSGWDAAADFLHKRASLAYSVIPGLGAATIAGHSGQLHWCEAFGVETFLFQGRRHFFLVFDHKDLHRGEIFSIIHNRDKK